MSKKQAFFDQLNDFFDNIYVIHLKRSIDRHSYIQEKLDGLDFELFWAIDGRELYRAELEKNGLYHSHLTKLLKKRKGLPARNLALTRIGCALSHVGVYKEMLKNNYQKILIKEQIFLVNRELPSTINQ